MGSGLPWFTAWPTEKEGREGGEMLVVMLFAIGHVPKVGTVSELGVGSCGMEDSVG